MSLNRTARRLLVENLEDRSMMATANVIGGILWIDGAAGDVNETVSVAQTSPGNVVVSLTSPSGTQVKQLSGVRSLLVDLKGGDDIFQTGEESPPLVLSGTANILMGSGRDLVILRVETPSAVLIDQGTQPLVPSPFVELASLDQSKVGALAVYGRDGNDHVVLTRLSAGSIYIESGVDYLTPGQTDSDSVYLANVAAADVVIKLGLAGGGKGVNVIDSNLGNLTVTGSQGLDLVAVAGTSPGSSILRGNVSISLFGGDDTVIFNEHQSQRSAVIDLGAGDDRAYVFNSAFDYFYANLGAGNDELATTSNLARFFAVDAGPGFDFHVRIADPSSNYGVLLLLNFEQTLDQFPY